jgi:hypothetical protein
MATLRFYIAARCMKDLPPTVAIISIAGIMRLINLICPLIGQVPQVSSTAPNGGYLKSILDKP